MTQFGFIVNLDACMDMRGCMTACKRQKDTPIGVYDLECFTNENGVYPHDNCYFVPVPCQHCSNPSCLPACPEDAIEKDDRGIVSIVKEDSCIDCAGKPCATACPYGAIDIDDATGKAYKCDMCKDLIDLGKKPACVGGCLTNAWYYGDFDDPGSQVNQILGEWAGYTHQLKPESGNQPNVHYLLSKKTWAGMDFLYTQNWHSCE